MVVFDKSIRPVSGASMNPARSLGPEYIWGCYKDLWLYIVSTVIGGLACAWTYFFFFLLNCKYHIMKKDFTK